MSSYKKNKKAIKKFHFKQRSVVARFKEDIGCMNPTCQWKGKYDGELLDFHHLDPSNKSYKMSQVSVNMSRFKEEIKKCTILCANCHRLVSHNKIRQDEFKPCPDFDYEAILTKLDQKLFARPPYKKSKKHYSLHVGVTYSKSTKKWQVLIKGKYLGLFKTEEEAIAAANEYKAQIS